jgi:hypothetical protein
MLSLVDLLDARTVDLPLASYLAAAMRSGASLLVGANPGGAGKTAVMVALLNFLPAGVTIRAIESRAVLSAAKRAPQPGSTCYLAHEISPATYYRAYIWGADVRSFFALRAAGHLIASNLHADTLEETREQLCGQNGVDPAHLRAVTLKIFLGVERGRGWSMKRWLNAVYESDGAQERLLWTGEAPGDFTREGESALVTAEEAAQYSDVLATLRERDLRPIEEVRRALSGGAPEHRL